MEIKRIDSFDDLWKNLIDFAKKCSWQSTGTYLAELMENNKFKDFEQIFCALEDNTIIGFCALVKTSCIENTQYFPWLDFVFVKESHRKQGIAKKMIEQVSAYAKSLNFNCLYLCTASHSEIYKKLNFKYLCDVNINENTPGIIMYKNIKKSL